MRFFTSILFIITILTGCFDRFDRRINDNYSFVAVDSKKSMSIVHDGGEYPLNIVPSVVFKVDIYDKYLVAFHHPLAGYDIEKNVTNVYILKANETNFYSAKNARIGPLSETDFLSMKDTLGKEMKNQILFENLQ